MSGVSWERNGMDIVKYHSPYDPNEADKMFIMVGMAVFAMVAFPVGV